MTAAVLDDRNPTMQHAGTAYNERVCIYEPQPNERSWSLPTSDDLSTGDVKIHALHWLRLNQPQAHARSDGASRHRYSAMLGRPKLWFPTKSRQ